MIREPLLQTRRSITPKQKRRFVASAEMRLKSLISKRTIGENASAPKISVMISMMMATLLFMIGGCGDGSQTGESFTSVEDAPAEEVALEPGDFKVSYEAGRIALFSNQAELLRILKRVAELTGIRLETAVKPNDEKITLNLEQATILEAVTRLLVGKSYSLDFGYGSNAGETVLTAIRVGQKLAGPSRLTPVDVENTPFPCRRTNKQAEMAPLEPPDHVFEGAGTPDIADVAELAALDHLVEQERVTEDLSFGSESQRKAAVDRLDPRGEALDKLIVTLQEDPDPAVRSAAANRISNGTGYAVTTALLDSLSDESPEVVLQALHGLGTLGDKSVIDEIRERLAQRNDARVQEALESTTERLRFKGRIESDGIAPGKR